MTDAILEMRGITKRFAGVLALDDVTFEVARGEIHALAGENGAGKSTLMKILSGVYGSNDYEGGLVFDGEERSFSTVSDSAAAGISIIFQELNLVGTMSIAENIFLGDEIVRRGRIDHHAQFKRTQELLVRVGLEATPDQLVSSLGTGRQQLVEIAKALNKQSRLLILDEPTAALTQVDSDNLLQLLDRFRSEGLTSIYISHKLEEVFAIADSITVLRDGRTISTDPIAATSEEQVIERMVGRRLDNRFPARSTVVDRSGVPAIEIKHWTVTDPDRARPVVDDVDLVAYPGEVVGIAGLIGAGRTELAMSVFGALELPSDGELLLDGHSVRVRSPEQAIARGLGYVSEDRKQYGLVLIEDIRQNMSLASLHRITRFGAINRSRELHEVQQKVRELRVKTPSIDQVVQNLSGGNQQKVILGKWLLTEPKVLILDEPTRGIDIGAKEEIYQIINDLAARGVCIVMISSELPEILGMSDRIYIMGGGRIRAELPMSSSVTQEQILFHAQGGASHEHVA